MFGIGLGGAGGAVLDSIFSSLEGFPAFVDAVIFNTAVSDKAKLKRLVDRFFLFGDFGGAGVGSRWKDSRRAALSPKWSSMFREVLSRRNLPESSAALLAAALGGGTGSGSLPVVADIVRELYGRADKPVLALGILPFRYPKESMRLAYNSVLALASSLEHLDSIILVDNDRVGSRFEEEPREEILLRINEVVADFVRVLTLPMVRPAGGPLKTSFDVADLASLVRSGRTSLVVPCYSRFRVEVVGSSLSFLVQAALDEGPMVEFSGSAKKAAVIFAGPEQSLTPDAILEAKETLAEASGSVDVRGAAAVLESKYVEAAVLLVDPKIPRIEELVDQASLFYDIHEDELSTLEDTDRSEFEGYLRALQGALMSRS